MVIAAFLAGLLFGGGVVGAGLFSKEWEQWKINCQPIPMISPVEYLFADSHRPPASRAGVLAAVPRGISPMAMSSTSFTSRSSSP